MSHLLRIGVLRGGPSSEYEVSLNTGAAVLAALRDKLANQYQVRDILIDRKGNWHIDGVPVQPHDLAHRIDIAFNALHGTYGEDGKIQSILETHGIPFTGSDSLASAVSMNKVLSKKILSSHGIKSPYFKEVSTADFRKEPAETALMLFSTFIMPAIVKPTSGGSSVGISIVRKSSEWFPSLMKAAEHGDSILIEEFIQGIEATGGVIQNFRGKDLYALPIVEIRPKTAFFDYDAKYNGQSEEIVPATFSAELKAELENLSIAVHKAHGLRHYSRSDFIVHPRRGVYVLEVNTLPGLTGESLIPKAMRAVGSDVDELVEHLIRLALG